MSQTDNTPTEIYLDMDGVLADFFAEYAKLAGVTSGSYRDIPPAKVDPTLNKMIGTDFFARLPMFPSAQKLMQLVLNYTDHYSICSSPLRGDHKNSEHHKRVWISKHLNPQPKDIVITGKTAEESALFKYCDELKFGPYKSKIASRNPFNEGNEFLAWIYTSKF